MSTLERLHDAMLGGVLPLARVTFRARPFCRGVLSMVGGWRQLGANSTPTPRHVPWGARPPAGENPIHSDLRPLVFAFSLGLQSGLSHEQNLKIKKS